MHNIKKGQLLISEPSLSDPTFFKSVVLLIHHSNDESIGLILNQPTKINLNQILDNIPTIDFPVYIGGPVERKSIHFIHTLGNIIPNTKEISNGISWGGDFNKIISLMKEKRISRNQIRFFAGYCGWGEGQLNNEVIEDGWIIHRSNINKCMQYSNEKLWSDLIRKKHSKYAIWTNMPKDPSLN